MPSSCICISVCLSVYVCVSVTLRYCVKMAKRRITHIMPHDRPWTIFQMGCFAGKAEARGLKFCTKGHYIKSGQRDDKSPLKGAWFCSCDPFLPREAMLSAVYDTKVHGKIQRGSAPTGATNTGGVG